ncbi:AMP-binding protein [Erwinia piriflorinigrans]|uniref:Nonribosomal peptide synthetase subunit n=1 Tax=Erwinia piriflorinigrans CFBP 5888 TaxID=1161919 RepID=V5ZCZ2_9GAMM|nr:AMP-binding protein [Erwinia piriflorinigrans]CCG89145.1 nonribosomal peptide synthetase subunit [Erwinia piriflorinigrans CFBP 5888]
MNQALISGAAAHHPLWHITSLHQALLRAAQQSEKGVTTVNAAGQRRAWSYAEFYPQALAVSHVLAEKGISAGDRVLLRLADPGDFVLALWGCLLLGAVAVPVAAGVPWPVEPSALKASLAALALIRPTAMIGSGADLTQFQLIQQQMPEAAMQVIAAAPFHQLTPRHDPCSYVGQGDDLAIIFPTSGSTGQPKLVTQSVRALLSMAAGTAQMNDFSERDVFLNWMPMDHVGAVVFLGIVPVCCAAQQIHLATPWVREDLARFPRETAACRATVSWVPNHVFSELSQMEAAADWDFSSLRFLVNAGESISDQMKRCASRFAAQGLKSSALRPAFGMSETCSGLTWSAGDGGEYNGYVDLGLPIPAASVRITDRDGEIVDEGQVGDLQVRGPSVTRGYFNGEAEDCFLEDGWFVTGDRALLHQGRLFITDRDGDGIAGLPIPGYQLEAELERIPGVRAGYTGVCQSGETVGIYFVCQPGSSAESVMRRMEIRLSELGTPLHWRLFPAETGQIPRTSIGKIQRKVLRRRLAAQLAQERVE